MILENLSNKVNPKKNIYRSTWKLEADNIALQKLRALGQRVRKKGRGGGRVE